MMPSTAEQSLKRGPHWLTDTLEIRTNEAAQKGRGTYRVSPYPSSNRNDLLNEVGFNRMTCAN